MQSVSPTNDIPKGAILIHRDQNKAHFDHLGVSLELHEQESRAQHQRSYDRNFDLIQSISLGTKEGPVHRTT